MKYYFLVLNNSTSTLVNTDLTKQKLQNENFY